MIFSKEVKRSVSSFLLLTTALLFFSNDTTTCTATFTPVVGEKDDATAKNHDEDFFYHTPNKSMLRGKQEGVKSMNKHQRQRPPSATVGHTLTRSNNDKDHHNYHRGLLSNKDSTTPTIYDNMCDKTVDLCEDGSTCAGLKQIFMSLCYHENEMMTQCTSDCAFLLNQLEREAEKQGRAIECVEYIQPDLPSKCSTAHNPEEEQSSSSTEPLISCPSENEYTKDLHAGEFETISCTDLYPSGIFGTGLTYRYCMIGGGGAINTNSCAYDDDVAQKRSRMLAAPSTSKISTISSESLYSNARSVSRGLSFNPEILEGATQANDILISMTELLGGVGGDDAAGMTKKIADVAGKLGSALGAVGIAFSVISAFLPEEDSAELEYMKQEFAIVNTKLDALQTQIGDVENRFIYENLKNQFGLYKNTLTECTMKMKYFQLSGTERSRDAFYDSCCTSADRKPLNYLIWMSSNVREYLEQAASNKDVQYDMDQFVSIAKAVIHSSITSAMFAMTCGGFQDLSDEALNHKTQDLAAMTRNIANTVQSKITALPNDYISYQLKKDVENVVREAGSNSQCAANLKTLITDRMKGWRYKPQASAYCYSASVSGYDEHSVLWEGGMNERYGCEFYKRLQEEYSVFIDWTSATTNIHTAAIKSALERRLSHSGDNIDLEDQSSDWGIKKVQEIVQASLGSGMTVRSVAYVNRDKDTPSVSNWSGNQYYLDIDYDHEFVCDWWGHLLYGDVCGTYSSNRYRIIFSIYPIYGYPKWPDHYAFVNNGIKPSGYTCIRVWEWGSGWNNNYFCWDSIYKNPGIRWSYQGNIANMRCTQIREPADPDYWHDNYLCVPHSSNLNFSWTYKGQTAGKKCVQWDDSAEDPHMWHDNYLCATQSCRTNVARNKPTSQSSTGWSGSSSRAVDGNTNGDYWKNSVTHTNWQTNPWWYVDLQSQYNIKQIKIYNRVDCCGARLSGFKVTVFNGGTVTWSWTHGGGTPGTVTTLNVPSKLGNKVQVMIPRAEYLQLAEVEVYGCAA